METDSDNEEKQQDDNLREVMKQPPISSILRNKTVHFQEEDEWEDVAEYQDDGALKGLPVENSLQLNR